MFGNFSLFSDIDINNHHDVGDAALSMDSGPQNIIEEEPADLENRLFNILFHTQDEASDFHDTDGYDGYDKFDKLAEAITPVVINSDEKSRPRKRSSVVLDDDAFPESRRRRSSATHDEMSLLSPSILEGTSNMHLSSPASSPPLVEEREVKKKQFKERTITVSAGACDGSIIHNAPRRKKHTRGSYKCRMCGLPKKNHKCKFSPLIRPRKKKRPKPKATVACQASFDFAMTVAYLKIQREKKTLPSPTPSPRPLVEPAPISASDLDIL